MTIPVETILELAEEARRSPHARRVLFDALSERYAPFFGNVVDFARSLAREDGQPRAVLLDPPEFAKAERENHWGRRTPPRDVVGRAVWSTPINNLRGLRRFYRRGDTAVPPDVTIVVVR